MWPFKKKETHINITINCEPIISTEKLQKIVEKEIIPILEDYAARGGKIDIKEDDIEPNPET